MQHAQPPFRACVGLPRQIAGLLTQTDAACAQILQASTKKTPEPESNPGLRCLHTTLALAGAQANRSILGFLCAHRQVADEGTHESRDIPLMENAADSQA